MSNYVVAPLRIIIDIQGVKVKYEYKCIYEYHTFTLHLGKTSLEHITDTIPSKVDKNYHTELTYV